jgi:hypothetical protein
MSAALSREFSTTVITAHIWVLLIPAGSINRVTRPSIVVIHIPEFAGTPKLAVRTPTSLGRGLFSHPAISILANTTVAVAVFIFIFRN